MSQNGQIVGRFFLVGCARSGTTLLQTLLVSHSLVFSLPETHFFVRARTGGRREKLGLASRRTKDALLKGLQGVDDQKLRSMVPNRSPFFSSYARAFVRILDQETMQNHKTTWVEKTPRHIQCIGTIERLINNARFIHIVRDGREVVASLYEVALQHPEIWGIRTIDDCVKRWNSDLQITLSRVGNSRHIVVNFSELVNEPQRELSRLCGFMGLDYEPGMLTHRQLSGPLLDHYSRSLWEQKLLGPLQHTALEKFTKVFTIDEQRYIEQRLSYGGRVINPSG